MTVSRFMTKSCCGSSAHIFESSKAIRKPGAQIFRDAGWYVPEDMYSRGIFYVKKDNLVATASYGATRVSVRCRGAKCPGLMDLFEQLLEQAISV